MTKTGGVDINCFQISASLKHLEISTLAKPRGQGTLKLGREERVGGPCILCEKGMFKRCSKDVAEA